MAFPPVSALRKKYGGFDCVRLSTCACKPCARPTPTFSASFHVVLEFVVWRFVSAKGGGQSPEPLVVMQAVFAAARHTTPSACRDPVIFGIRKLSFDDGQGGFDGVWLRRAQGRLRRRQGRAAWHAMGAMWHADRQAGSKRGDGAKHAEKMTQTHTRRTQKNVTQYHASGDGQETVVTLLATVVKLCFPFLFVMT